LRKRRREFAWGILLEFICAFRAKALTHVLYQILLGTEGEGLSKLGPDISSSGPADQRTPDPKWSIATEKPGLIYVGTNN
jgi:hypothetical protein